MWDITDVAGYSWMLRHRKLFLISLLEERYWKFQALRNDNVNLAWSWNSSVQFKFIDTCVKYLNAKFKSGILSPRMLLMKKTDRPFFCNYKCNLMGSCWQAPGRCVYIIYQSGPQNSALEYKNGFEFVNCSERLFFYKKYEGYFHFCCFGFNHFCHSSSTRSFTSSG